MAAIVAPSTTGSSVATADSGGAGTLTLGVLENLMSLIGGGDKKHLDFEVESGWKQRVGYGDAE